MYVKSEHADSMKKRNRVCILTLFFGFKTFYLDVQIAMHLNNFIVCNRDIIKQYNLMIKILKSFRLRKIEQNNLCTNDVLLNLIYNFTLVASLLNFSSDCNKVIRRTK
jgi:hypothetical protein